MGIIIDKVKTAFDVFKSSLENQQEQSECIKGLVKSLVDVADNSVHSQGHRDILDAEIEKQFGEL